MALHLVKLCVGATDLQDMRDWVAERQTARQAAGEVDEQFHTTRMIPKRMEELLDGDGSLYWVIRGHIQARQRLLDIRPFTGEDGIRRCRLILEPVLVETQVSPRRPFQGWRYLEAADAPGDLDTLRDGELPPALRQQLASLGLL